MNVSLTPELESLVYEKVKSGLYTSASEVVREALRLLNDKDTIQQRRLAELPNPDESLAEALEGSIGVLDSSTRNGGRVPHIAENTGEEFTKIIVDNRKPDAPALSLAEMLAGRIGLFESDGPGYRAQQMEKTFADHVADKHRSDHL